MTIDKQPESVSSVMKTFGILQALATQKDIGISDLAQRLMMSKSTVYRFLQTMKTMGYVSQEGETENYSLTLKLFELGAAALEYVDLVELADVEMRRISDLTMEALHLGALDGDGIIYIHKIDSKYNLRMQSRIGRRNPLYSTAIGKVLLAERSEEEVRQILAEVEFTQSTENTHSDVDSLLKELPIVKEQGFAQDNEEQEVGLRCLAVPVYDRFNRVVAGMSVSLPTIRFTEQKQVEYVQELHQAAARISAKLGCVEYPYLTQK
ncbi:DNA-binding transcriptional regulator KdgR [Vibrio tarriae]|uniref:DNA-binding transcriptional regulator KdgR n=2 Tax=Vibrio TaxID=662 RepID=A0AAU8W9K0_9VIBR|nr:DNA-binding transcriptional regulator KdgR [Vibrio tarriae]QEO47502.1 DNA-binding transcriptional regulator KdgR [Vibrio cholerae]ASK53507.1 DNA-binding transcriptional regulator KdgR [Vibrio tarriae]RBM25178.1 DNA-binding transcriptional regulator KdgR [Vibrio tarriae]RBM26094.1 DNA-binding transcriptional regulator KdgR [Vibrio tarriae]RBM30817.1 DNA-binding transcriptional regulator KdgR [Vibrio tarriae]